MNEWKKKFKISKTSIDSDANTNALSIEKNLLKWNFSHSLLFFTHFRIKKKKKYFFPLLIFLSFFPPIFSLIPFISFDPNYHPTIISILLIIIIDIDRSVWCDIAKHQQLFKRSWAREKKKWKKISEEFIRLFVYSQNNR